MPGISKGQRAEAKYNVILDFPHLGLHSAAATGDIGLVKYALEHGQPINSALDGVLPLHAACSGGNDLVVRLLIEKGADVNAPRLPRKYSTDKNRDTSAPIVGRSGSTPLHFACANGHTTVVLTLLLHGAHPERPDKHGVTPEVLARNNGWNDCADVLRQWSHNKDKDLRDREGPRSSEALSDSTDHISTGKGQHHYCGKLDCVECATRKRLRVKRSIDNAIHILKPSLSHTSSPCPILAPLASTSTSSGDEPHSPAAKPPVEYTFYPTSDTGNEPLPPRRPSLPHALDVPPRTSVSSSRRPSGVSTSSRRPRSAGTDADQSVGTPPKVKGKISLLNIFKKGAGETPESLSGYNSSSSAFTSASPSPAPEPRSSISIASGSYRGNRSTDVLAATPPESSPLGGFAAQRLRNRLLSESSSHSPSRLQAVELRHAHSKESLLASNDVSPSPSTSTPDQQSSTRSPPPIRPILRAHGRSSSSSQSANQGTPDSSRVHSPGPSVRALRFDSTTSTTPASHTHPHSRRSDRHDHRTHNSRSPSRGPRGSTSFSSLRSHSPGSPWGASFRQESEGDISIPYTSPPLEYQEIRDKEGNGDIEEEDEDEYGNPVVPHVGLGDLEEGGQLSSSSSSSSDLVLPSQPSADPNDSPTRVFQCPFSINHPPLEDSLATSSTPSNLLGIDGIDSRMRGDSLSSMSTNPSAYVVTPALSHMNLPGPTVYSPLPIGAELPEGLDELPDVPEAGESPYSKRSLVRQDDGDESSQDEEGADVETDHPPLSPPISSPSSHTTRSSRTSRPVDIDIRSISSHAQAEALVQQAQQRIFDFVNKPSIEDVIPSSGGSGPGSGPGSTSVLDVLGLSVGASGGNDGRTPLSARLAAYGESLVIEQKFKEEEETRRSPSVHKHSHGSARSGGSLLEESAMRERERAYSHGHGKEQHGGKGLDRTFSLEERHHTPGSPHGNGRSKKIRRPHTAGGTPISDTPGITISPSRDRSPMRTPSHHQHSLSSAAALSSFEPASKSSAWLAGSSGTNTPLGGISPASCLLHPTATPAMSKTTPRSESHPLPLSLPHSHSHTHSSHSYSNPKPPPPALSPLDRPRIQRSRTPDPPDIEYRNRTPATFGVPLSRYSTAPHDGFVCDVKGTMTLSKQEREVARANKLTKMGFAAVSGTGAADTWAAGRGGAAVPAGGGAGGQGHKPRFGGLKTLVQSLTGKN